MSRPLRYPLTVFYDASCPLCADEMHALRELDSAGRIDLVDCSAPEFSDEGLRAEGITRAALMQRIHARDARGRWLRGMHRLVRRLIRGAARHRAANAQSR